jgi:ribose/xylose/arabinose/galactoside ABC-type transport system permease subunit
LEGMINNKTPKLFVRNILLGNKAFFILLIMACCLSIMSPYFLTKVNLLNVLRQVCVSTLLSIGFTMVLASGHMDLSVGSLLGLCGMVLAKLIMEAHVPVWLAILMMRFFAVFCGAINAAIITVFKVPPFIVTMATQYVFRGANYLISKLIPIAGLPDSLTTIGQGYWFGIPIPVYIMFAVVVIMWIVLDNTKFGRYVLAMGGNLEAAKMCGINTDIMRFSVYMCGGFCTGLAAIVATARAASAQVGAGTGMEMDAIAAVVIGGTSMKGGNANVTGTLFGCLIVGLVNNGLNLLNVDSNWQVVAKGLLILLAVIIDVLSANQYAAQLNKQASENLAKMEGELEL